MLCRSCGRTLEPNAQFCGECGAQVGAIADAPLDAAGAGPVTVPDLPPAPPPPTSPGAPPVPAAPPSFRSAPPPPPGDGGPMLAAAPAAPGGSSQRWALWLIGALAIVIVAFLASVAFYVLRDDGDGDDAAPAPVTTAVAPTVTTETPTTETPDTEPDPTTSTLPDLPEGGADTIEEYCANAEALGALLQQAITDPLSADVDAITELSAALSEDAAALSASATPEEAQQISDCTSALVVTPP